MKHSIRLLTLAGLLLGSAAIAQDTPPATPPDQATTAAPAPEAVPVTPAKAPEVAAAETAPTATPATTAEAAPAAATTAPSEPAKEPQAPASPDTIIPLIVMDDVPLTDAIKNLARQAGLNYMLDPKVNFGQVGPDGKVVPQPIVSIRWENVTAAQALNALLSNYNLQLVDDPKSKIQRITVKDPAAPDPLVTYIIQLKYATPTNIVSAIQSTLIDKRSKVVADVRTSQLVVLATEKEMVDINVMIEKLDTPTKQVLIEARLLETSFNPSTTKGVDWSGTLERQTVTWGNNNRAPSEDSTRPPLAKSPIPKVIMDMTGSGMAMNTAFLNADGVSAVFSFLKKYGEAKVISSPRTVTLDNEPAKIEVTRASPIINVTPGTVQVAGGSQITYTNLGIMLNVTPRISANNQVNLKVEPEVSRVSDTIKKVVDNGIYEADQYDIRKIQTRVMIPSGNTLVLGGLVQDDVRKGGTKVPLLGDIPIIGVAFRSESKSRQKSNLMVFVTPTIITDEDFQPTTSNYLKTPVPKTDDIEEDWSAFDSGKTKKQIDQERAASGAAFAPAP